MSSVPQPRIHLEIPSTLKSQLDDFRRRVWQIKLTEAAAVAIFAVLTAFLCVFALDRLWDTPRPLRTVVFLAMWGACMIIPWYVHRWIWSQRRPDQLARLLGKKLLLGDHLLGIIELVRSESEQKRSQQLCEAAIVQVAEEAQSKNFRDAEPETRHRMWSVLAGLAAVVVFCLTIFAPAASSNAWARLLTPWTDTPRYTFVDVQDLPKELIIAHGEPHSLRIALADETVWRPAEGEAWVGRQQPLTAKLSDDGAYVFELPPQIEDGSLRLQIGDFRHDMQVRPTLRPELTSMVADITLPEYLERSEHLTRDVRGGSISIVKGGRVDLTAEVGRELSSATIDGQSVSVSGSSIKAPQLPVEATREVMIEWRDIYGLAGQEPFELSIKAAEDEAPALSVEDLPRKKVVLDSQQLTFKVKAQDDFGVRHVGIEWEGLDETLVEQRAEGERIIAAGGSEETAMEVTGTFSAQSQGIEPQPIRLRVFVEDYLPGRERVYSSEHVLYVLNAEQHAIWVTEQLSRWHRASLEVRDRELQLYATNKELRELAPEDLDQPEARERIDRQSAAERANGRRLTRLTDSGKDLIREAARNPELGVGHLEKWAEMLKVLEDISENRMPSVADLLKEAAESEKMASNSSKPAGPTVGQMKNTPQGQGASEEEADKDKNQEKKNPVPGIADAESSQQPAKKNKEEEEQEKKKPSDSASPLRLPVTTLTGGGGKGGKKPPAKKKMDQAIEEQENLLAEFDRIADELNNILANLEGSTLVKRLKAASREQYKIADKISDQIDDAFGIAAARIDKPEKEVFKELSEREDQSSQTVSYIMDDMQAYFERRRMTKFKSVLDEMKKEDIVGNLRILGEDIPNEHGLSIAQAEYWSDNLDRWAEDLVDPSNCGACPGCKGADSLPPSIVLEVLQVLEAEINLREETRVAEQAKAALKEDNIKAEALKLSNKQKGLKTRIDDVEQRIRELKDAEKQFGKEIALMMKVSTVMQEAADILAEPNTGSPAIAAETEVIELLLQSKRINPKGGGGGGTSPGGGGTGDTNDPALALIGAGVNEKEVREETDAHQATGETGSKLPEEYQAGLDEYFNQFERATP